MERIKYDKENTITIDKDTPTHLVTYLMGVIMGMGISYKLDPNCPLYRMLHMREKRWYDDMKKQEGTRAPLHSGQKATVYTSGEDIKVDIK